MIHGMCRACGTAIGSVNKMDCPFYRVVGTEERIPIPLMDYILNVVSADSAHSEMDARHIAGPTSSFIMLCILYQLIHFASTQESSSYLLKDVYETFTKLQKKS